MAQTSAEQRSHTPLILAVENQDFDEVQRLVQDGADVNEEGENGLTPITMASFKGNYEIAKFLLEKGADVNTKKQFQGFTALMFGALAGKPELCRLLLDYGADSSYTNSIGKTATQLAAFTGLHECASVISNHVTINQIDDFLRTADDPINYPTELSKFIHELICTNVIHPVAIVFKFTKFEDALTYRKKLLYVVDRVFEKQLRSKESNEVMSLKLWILLVILRDIYKHLDMAPERSLHEKAMAYARKLLVMTSTDMIRPQIDLLLRGAVVSFPYTHSLLHSTLLRTLSKSAPGNRPDAYDYVVQGLFGQRLHALSQFCYTCGSFTSRKKCGACKTPYCSKECQVFDWPIHKACCASLKEAFCQAQSEAETINIEDIDLNVKEPANSQEAK